MIRPISNHHRPGASAMNRKSTPVPKFEASTTGRRPMASDRPPCIGVKRNCASPHAAPKMPVHSPASETEPFRKLMIRRGKTGMITPIDNISRKTVTRIKAAAALRGCTGVSDIGYLSCFIRL